MTGSKAPLPLGPGNDFPDFSGSSSLVQRGVARLVEIETAQTIHSECRNPDPRLLWNFRHGWRDYGGHLKLAGSILIVASHWTRALRLASGRELWCNRSLEYPGSGTHEADAEPIIHGKSVIISTLRDGVLAFEIESGRKLWDKPYRVKWMGIGQFLYMASIDGVILALNPTTGEERWRSRFTNDWTKGGLAIADGLLIVGAGSATSETKPNNWRLDNHHVRALDGWTGAELWRTSLARTTDGLPPSVVACSTGVLLRDGDNVVTMVEARTSMKRWTHGQKETLNRVFIDGDAVFLVTTYGSLTVLHTATGELLWRIEPGEVKLVKCVEDGIVYVECDGPRLDALDLASGKLLWSFKGDGMPEGWEIAVLENIAYVGTGHKQYDWPYWGEDDQVLLHAIDASSGKEIWSIELLTGPVSSIIAASAGVFVDSMTEVLAFEPVRSSPDFVPIWDPFRWWISNGNLIRR